MLLPHCAKSSCIRRHTLAQSALGFKEQLDAIAGAVRPDAQRLLCSATAPAAVQAAVDAWVPNPVLIKVMIVDAATQSLTLLLHAEDLIDHVHVVRRSFHE